LGPLLKYPALLTLTFAGLLIVINALFVLMEFAIVKVRASRVEVLARKGNPRALAVQDILARLDDYLSAIQFGITAISLALGWLGEPAIAELVKEALALLNLALTPHVLHVLSFGVALAVLSFVHIVFGELVPRSIGIQKAETFALLGARPLKVFVLAFRLPVALMSRTSVALLKVLGLHSAAHAESVVSEEEMRVLLGETQEHGALPLERMLLLENLFDIGQSKVAEAMVPRDKIVYLSLSKSDAENLEVIKSRRLSRYPLCETDLDTAVGFIHVKDLLLKMEDGKLPDLRRMRRDAAEVLESEPLDKLVKAFPDKGIHMALVRNGMGKIVGLITLEDIVEELIGEVHDEFDLPQAWSLMDVLVPQAAVIGTPGAGRREAVEEILTKLCAAEPKLKFAEVMSVVWERELKLSSALGRGVAAPHGRLQGIDRAYVGVARFPKPVPFPAPDSTPIRLVFLILTPASQPVAQLKVLGRIASLITNENIRRKLARAKTPEGLLETLKTADTLLAV
jgi:CBS domain containing-hemolysin-like protein/mannitol/fructose-specific phosphotransferase system IIA component (Ntr-type)